MKHIVNASAIADLKRNPSIRQALKTNPTLLDKVKQNTVNIANVDVTLSQDLNEIMASVTSNGIFKRKLGILFQTPDGRKYAIRKKVRKYASVWKTTKPDLIQTKLFIASLLEGINKMKDVKHVSLYSLHGVRSHYFKEGGDTIKIDVFVKSL